MKDPLFYRQEDHYETPAEKKRKDQEAITFLKELSALHRLPGQSIAEIIGETPHAKT